MDQDFYIEETSPIKIVLVVFLILGLIGGGVYYYFNYFAKNSLKLKSVTVELGEQLPQDINTYIKAQNVEDYLLDLESVSIDENGNVNSTGEYSYKVSKGDKVKKGKIYVKDTKVPIVEVQSLTVGVDEDFDAFEFVTKCEDLSIPCDVKYKSSKDMDLNKKEGTYNTTIVISDAEGNKVEKDVTLVVSSTLSLDGKKAADLTVHHTSLEDNSWNQSFTLKLDKGVKDEGEDYQEIIMELSAKEYDFEKEVSNKEIVAIYNQYDYVIGFSIKVTFTDESVLFVTSDNAKEINTELQGEAQEN